MELTSETWRQSLVRPDVRQFCFYDGTLSPFVLGEENGGKKIFLWNQDHSETVEAQYMTTVHTSEIHSQNRHDRHTCCQFRLLTDNSSRDTRGVWTSWEIFVWNWIEDTTVNKNYCSYSMIHVTEVLYVRSEEEHTDTYTYMISWYIQIYIHIYIYTYSHVYTHIYIRIYTYILLNTVSIY